MGNFHTIDGETFCKDCGKKARLIELFTSRQPHCDHCEVAGEKLPASPRLDSAIAIEEQIRQKLAEMQIPRISVLSYADKIGKLCGFMVPSGMYLAARVQMYTGGRELRFFRRGDRINGYVMLCGSGWDDVEKCARFLGVADSEIENLIDHAYRDLFQRRSQPQTSQQSTGSP